MYENISIKFLSSLPCKFTVNKAKFSNEGMALKFLNLERIVIEKILPRIVLGIFLTRRNAHN